MRYLPWGAHTLPPLPYAYNALEPFISARNLRIHHDVLHLGYVEGLTESNQSLFGQGKEMITPDQALGERLAFYGSGHILHCIYWTNLSPRGGVPQEHTQRLISRDFGSFERFQAQLTEAAEKVEASGWGILVWQPAFERLQILTAEKHQNLTQWGAIPLLVFDVWEHAYYLDYQSSRAQYINGLWQLVNWEDVERRLLAAFRGEMPGIP